MCDPVSLALASTAATVVGAGGSLMSSMGAAKAAKRQQQEVSAWQQQQKKNRDASFVRQEELRKEADASRTAGLDQLAGEEQNKRQAEAEAELTKQFTGEGQVAADEAGTPVTSAADAALAGQNTGNADAGFKNELAVALNNASKGARQRMAALAGVRSFGQVQEQNKDILNKAGADIDMFNEFRRGELGVLGAQQAVDPVQVSYTPSPLADAFSTALQVGSQGLGNAFGGGGDAWSGLRQTALPQTAPIPTARPQILPKYAPIPPTRVI